jgi:hypothetical protein
MKKRDGVSFHLLMCGSSVYKKFVMGSQVISPYEAMGFVVHEWYHKV